MTSLIYAAPALLFLFGLYVCWTRMAAGKRWPKGWGLLAIWACYVSAGALLVLGGCKRIAQVRLEGVEMDLAEGGKARILSVGGQPDAARAGKLPQPAIEVDGFPADAFRLVTDGKVLRLEAGKGWQPGLIARSGGKLVPVGGLPRLVPLRDGDEIVLAGGSGGEGGAAASDPLDGVMVWKKGAPWSKATLEWRGKPQVSRVIVREGETVTAGGGIGDRLPIPGLKAGALELSLEADGLLLRNRGGVPGMAAEWRGQPGKALRIGGPDTSWGGRLGVVKLHQATPPAAVEGDGDGEVTDEEAPPAAKRELWCQWETGTEVRWDLPRRRMILPVVKKEVEVFAHLKWADRVYGLAEMAARPTRYQSAVVFGASGLGFEQPGLLILDRGVEVRRAGKVVSDGTPTDGELSLGAPLEFLTLRSSGKEGGRAVRVARRIGVPTLERQVPGAPPYLRVVFTKPEVKAIPLGEIKRDLKENENADGKVAFGINERQEFATLPHQVKFRTLWPWFKRATGEVEMHWLGMTVQDDYRRRACSFGESFTIGGKDRLRIGVEKMGIPWRSLAWLGLGLVVASVAAWPWLGGAAGTGVFFGVAFLTCSRGVFGHAVWVNAPYDPEVAAQAWRVAVVLPVLLSLLWWLGGRIKQGAPGRVLDWVARRGALFCMAAAAALLVVRLGLLSAGFKEGLPVGGMRLALSAVFVPAFLVLQVLVLSGVSGVVASGGMGAIWKRLGVLAWVFGCQAASSLVVSDLGGFLFLLPGMLMLAALAGKLLLRGLADGSRMMESWRRIAALAGTCLVMAAPLLAMAAALTWPRAVVRMAAGDLDAQLAREERIVTDSTLLRLLHSADETYLMNLGTDAAEEILQDHAIMENYAGRGLTGSGFLGVRVIPAKQVTGLNDNVAAVYLMGQFGFLGALAACVAYLGVSLAGAAGGGGRRGMLAYLAASTFALVSLYMLGANAGVLPFTGRNMYLWGLNSLGDVAESTVLLGLLVFALTPSRTPRRADSSAAEAPSGPEPTGKPAALPLYPETP